MPHIQQSIVDPPIRCVSCAKIIAQGNMSVGRIIIRCKCGVENVIEARNKPEGLKREFINIDTSSSVEMFRRVR